ncbi:hypothetical protein BH11PLA2_BH11PLA2_37210 [soil metagenome]
MDRATRLVPIILLLAGAGAGLCLGMLTHNDSPYQVHLEDSIPLVLLGGFVGALAGCGVTAACLSRPRLVRPVRLASVALLGAMVAAPHGWIIGTRVASERLPRADVKEDVQHLPPLGLAVGVGIGCLAGLVLGRMQELRERRRPSAEPRRTLLMSAESRESMHAVGNLKVLLTSLPGGMRWTVSFWRLI